MLAKPPLRCMEQSGLMESPAPLRRERIIQTLAQEESCLAQSSQKCLKRGGPFLLSESLNRAPLDDDIKRTGTHSSVEKVSNHKFSVPSCSTRLEDAGKALRLLGESHRDGRDVERRYIETRRRQCVRLLRDAVSRTENSSKPVLAHDG